MIDKGKVISSLAYKFVERFSVKGIGFVISLILLRLLTPDDFGRVAILNVFISLSQTVVESGLGVALVQSREVDDRDYSTVFYIGMALSALMVLALYFAAPLVAEFYKSPVLVLPLRVYSLSLFFGSFNSIQVAIIQRGLRFKEQLRCSLVATLISGTLGVTLAFRGAGLWALIAYYFAQIVVYCLAMLTALRWLPRSRFSVDSARRLYGFGGRMLASALLNSIYNDVRPLIIGKKFSTGDLGYYDRGQQFSSIISLNIDAAVQSVMLPVFSKSQNDREQLRGLVRRSVSVGTLLIFPAMLGMAAVAEPMVRLLLTDKWLPSVIFVRVLCLAETQVPLTSTNLVVLKALGRSDVYMKQEILRRSLMLAVLLFTVFAFDSVPVIACGFAFSAWLDAFVTSMPLKKLIGYGFAEQLRDVWKTGVAAIVMGLTVYAMNLLALPLAVKLTLQVLCGAAVYVLACRALGSDGYMYVRAAVKSYLHRERERKHE